MTKEYVYKSTNLLFVRQKIQITEIFTRILQVNSASDSEWDATRFLRISLFAPLNC